MNKYKVNYNQKVPISKQGEVSRYKLVNFTKKIKANSYADARDKVRHLYGYDIVDIRVKEIKKNWLTKILKNKGDDINA